MNEDKSIQNQIIFAVGFSNGGFWAGYLAGTAKVNSGISYYGVWKANYDLEFTNPYPMKYFQNLVRRNWHFMVTGTKFNEWNG